jgi:hypothetical protein
MLILLPGERIRGALIIAHKDIYVTEIDATIIEEGHYDSVVKNFVALKYLTVEDFDVSKVRTEDVGLHIQECYYNEVRMHIRYANMDKAIPLPKQEKPIEVSRFSGIDPDLDLDEIICDNITIHTESEAIEQNKIKFNSLSKEELKAWKKAIKEIQKPFTIKFWRIAYSPSNQREGVIWLGQWKWEHLWKGIWIAYVKRDGL